MLRYIIGLLLFAYASACPLNAAIALTDMNPKDLITCDSATLKSFYNSNACCINNLAECNYIEKAWWLRVNVLKHEPLCDYMLRHPEHMKHFKKRVFLRRIKKRLRRKLVV